MKKVDIRYTHESFILHLKSLLWLVRRGQMEKSFLAEQNSLQTHRNTPTANNSYQILWYFSFIQLSHESVYVEMQVISYL